MPSRRDAALPGRGVDLVGRDTELDRLRALIAGVVAGRGGSVWLDGEPGIGKSALLAAALADAEKAGCLVFAAQADDTGTVFPLRPLLDALQVKPGATDPDRAEIADGLWGRDLARNVTHFDPAAAAAELLLLLVDRLCATGPVVLAIDDMQWADRLTLATWLRLHRASAQLPLLIVAAARPVPIREEVDQLRRGMAAHVVTLGPLDRTDVTTLLARLLCAAPGPRLARLVGSAGGSPLFVRELVNALILEHRIEVAGDVAELVEGITAGPASLGAAIATRLNFLSEQATRTLRMATLLGAEFYLEHLALLAGDLPELLKAVEEGRAAGVLAESGTTLVFRHALIRQGLYEGMPAPIRAALHHRAARVLAAAGVPAEQVAGQLRQISHVPDGWTIKWVTAEAPLLISRAPELAADLLFHVRQAIGITDPRIAHLDLHLLTALLQLSRYAEIEALARPLLLSIDDPEASGQIAWVLVQALTLTLRYEEALAACDQVLNTMTVTPVWSARLRAIQAMTLAIFARFDQAAAAGALAEAEGNRLSDPLAKGYAILAHSIVEHFHRRDEIAALATVDRGLAAVGQERLAASLRLTLLENRMTSLLNLGRRADRDRALGETLALAERSGSQTRLASIRMRAGEINFYSGHWDDAVAELDAANELPIDAGRRLLLRGFRGLIAVHRDDEATAAACLRPADDPPAMADVWFLGVTLLFARAAAAERDGKIDEAWRRLLDAIDPSPARQFRELSPDRCWWLPDLVRLALTTGEGATAESATRACMAEADRNPLPASRAAALQCQGLLESDAGLLLAAAEAYQAIDIPLWRAQALENAAVVMGRQGDANAARTVHARAIQIYTGLDAGWDIRRADARLRILGVRRRARSTQRRPATGWEALTVSEIKIAQLVTAGKSNSAIAAELYLSRNTVQTHVSHILAKLNVQSRVDIAREAMNRQ